MAYTPELSYRRSATLRRLAWFRGKPMSKTLEALLEATGQIIAAIRPGGKSERCILLPGLMRSGKNCNIPGETIRAHARGCKQIIVNRGAGRERDES